MEFQQVVELVGKASMGRASPRWWWERLSQTAIAAARLARQHTGVYRSFRHHLGRSILLGLEFLVAADIIRTVAVRTFLSLSLELEITGRWPWQKTDVDTAAPAPEAR